MITHGTTHFALTEFQHPEIVNPRALDLLEAVRVRYAEPLIVTDDGRPPGDVPPGGSAESLHFKGQAFDLRSRDLTRQQMWRLVAAIQAVAQGLDPTEAGVEIEIVWSGPAQHLHVGFSLDGSPDRLDGKD